MTTNNLNGKTLFITGASRGIGKAIALRAAQDGANIIIAAKTSQKHPTLEGTIYTAAEEIRRLGGDCLPAQCDIRFEDQVRRAVEEGAAKFGGIDIVVNNASAINLTGTLDTDMKRFDLMHQINTRGTFLTSKLCLPHLFRSSNPHILNISPPLSMNPKWFKAHVAYTMAKYGMSMCVLGMAEEFRDKGVAVNALWPKTAIVTAATKWLGGDEITRHSRKPEIMADAAYWILTRPSRECTGNFFIDEDLLRKNCGVTNFDRYACVPGETLMIDFFVDEALDNTTGWLEKTRFSASHISSKL
jgi:citronellol/citronellal dehydrogenase